MSAAAGLLQNVGPMPARVERRLREATYEHTGIVLGPEKTSLLTARVQKRLRALGIDDWDAYLERFETDPAELQQFINVMTTNTTSFFREPEHFPMIQQQLEAWIAQGQRRFRLWCAAASTGQEPWTIAMVLSEFADRGFDVQLLATDIDTKALATAHQAVYPPAAVAQVPLQYREAAFEKVASGYRIRESLRKLVRYAQLNLTKPPFPMKGPLDIVLCRNVMIYLDAPTRQRLVHDVERLLRPDGLFLIGHSESVVGLTRNLRITRPSVYRMPPRSP